MAKPTRSNRNAGPKKKKKGGNVETTAPRVEEEEEDAASRNDPASRPAKSSPALKKPILVFETKQAADSEHIWDGEVVEHDGELDGEYSIEDPDNEEAPYDLDAIIGSRQSSVDRRQQGGGEDQLPQLDVPVTSGALFEGGYVPVGDFRPNTAFESIRTPPRPRKAPIPSDNSNWRKPTPAPHPVELVSEDEEDEYGDEDDNDDEDGTTSPVKLNLRPPEPIPVPQPGSPSVKRPTVAHTITPTNTGGSRSLDAKVDGTLDHEMTEDEIIGVRKAVNEFIGDDVTMKKAVWQQLKSMGQAQRAVLSHIAHTQTAKVFERLGFIHVDSKSNEYIRQYNAEILSVMLGRELGLTDENVKVEREGDVNERMIPSFEQQRRQIEARLAKGKSPVTEERIDDGVPLLPKDKPESTPAPRPAKSDKEPKPKPVKEEPEDKPLGSNGRSTPSDIRELKNRVALQRIRLSQMKDGLTPTVPDQGIVFDDKNNAWLRPETAAGEALDKNPDKRDKVEKGGRGGPPSDDGSSGDESGDDDKCRDPFTPRPSSRGASTAPPARLTEAKVRHSERKYQQIIDFVRKNLENVITIPDGVKSSRFDPKSLKKYDGTASRDVFWEWLRSVVYGYRIAQLGGPERDEERLFILDSLLDGKAKQWFQYRFDRLGKPTPSFLEMLIEIYNRFIHDSALQDARQAFKDAKWDDTDESIEGWKDLLKQLVDDMDIPPDEYSIKSKFMEGIPRHIQSRIFADKMSVEYNSLEELYQAGLDAEYAVKAERRFAKSAKTSRSNDERPERAPKGVEFKMPRNNNFGNRRRFMNPQSPGPGAVEVKPTDKPQYTERCQPQATKPTRPKPTEVKGAGNDNGVRRRPIICFRCGKEGHIASSQECPENGKKPSYAQIRAAHTIILDAISESVGAEEHPEAEGNDETGSETYDNVKMEIYEEEYEDSDGSEDNVETMNYITEADGASGSDTDEPSSDDEVVYGNPSEEGDWQTIPLADFGGPIPDSATSPVLRIRVDPRTVVRPEDTTLRAMTEVGEMVPQQGKVQLRVQKEPTDRPTPKDKRCLVTSLDVNGLEAVTLWDSGSTATAMSPAFADISKATVSRLHNPVVLQLGTVGSRAKINFGTYSNIDSEGFTGPEYFDVVNIDRYDVIVGTPFMHRNKVILDFDKKCVIVNGKRMRGKVLDGDEADKIARRVTMEEVADEETTATHGESSERIEEDNNHDRKSERLPENYCQPSSSKVKVEDMVTDEMDDQHFRDHHDDYEEEVKPDRRRFWDRPVPPPQMAWPGDARMPIEWNMLINDMRGIETDPQGYREKQNDVGTEEDGTSIYEASLAAESIGPYEFTRSRYPTTREREDIKRMMTVEPDIGTDVTMERIAHMRARGYQYEKKRHGVD
ncbi:uncharacterized protein ARMOST_03111 [Armillaria ostoyae]|uniref:CCHC-type domain-containing protein n=1 Tax=Armillaria ostoyae TaxID=47428 RepID=A0A284QTJ6_ARMOS|nr:uncharacterized protein ARMOST_03111 [Armillaria ostoyae]